MGQVVRRSRVMGVFELQILSSVDWLPHPPRLKLNFQLEIRPVNRAWAPQEIVQNQPFGPFIVSKPILFGPYRHQGAAWKA